MSFDPFWWLRLFVIVLITLVSTLFGLDPAFDPNTATLGGLVAVLFETTEEGIESSGGLDGLAALSDEDEPLEEITDEPITVIPPTSEPNDSGPGGGVIGGGVSEGPDPTATSPAATSTAIPTSIAAPPTPTNLPPTATLPPTSTASPIATSVPTSIPTGTPTLTPAPTATPDPNQLRLDDLVLRWLPEIRASAQANGVPVSLLAALVRVESQGDASLIAADGGRGLAGVSEPVLNTLGVPADAWHDPATNLMAAGAWIGGLQMSQGSLDGALQAAWGTSCDALGQCAGLFAYAVLAWQRFYDPIVANPGASSIPVLPSNWTAPPIAPYMENNPRPIPLPSGTAPPTPTATPEPTATSTPDATETPAPTATAEPTATEDVSADDADFQTPVAPTPPVEQASPVA